MVPAVVNLVNWVYLDSRSMDTLLEQHPCDSLGVSSSAPVVVLIPGARARAI